MRTIIVQGIEKLPDGGQRAVEVEFIIPPNMILKDTKLHASVSSQGVETDRPAKD